MLMSGGVPMGMHMNGMMQYPGQNGMNQQPWNQSGPADMYPLPPAGPGGEPREDVEGIMQYLANQTHNQAAIIGVLHVVNWWNIGPLPLRHHGVVVQFNNGHYLSIDLFRKGIAWNVSKLAPDGSFPFDMPRRVESQLFYGVNHVHPMEVSNYINQTSKFSWTNNNCIMWTDGLMGILGYPGFKVGKYPALGTEMPTHLGNPSNMQMAPRPQQPMYPQQMNPYGSNMMGQMPQSPMRSIYQPQMHSGYPQQYQHQSFPQSVNGAMSPMAPPMPQMNAQMSPMAASPMHNMNYHLDQKHRAPMSGHHPISQQINGSQINYQQPQSVRMFNHRG